MLLRQDHAGRCFCWREGDRARVRQREAGGSEGANSAFNSRWRATGCDDQEMGRVCRGRTDRQKGILAFQVGEASGGNACKLLGGADGNKVCADSLVAHFTDVDAGNIRQAVGETVGHGLRGERAPAQAFRRHLAISEEDAEIFDAADAGRDEGIKVCQ